MDIFRKTPMAQKTSHLQRRLGLAELIFLGVGSMVGTGIFTITGVGASQYAGPSITISIIIAAICVTMSALFFAEFASRLLIQAVFIAICILFLVSIRLGLLVGL